MRARARGYSIGCVPTHADRSASFFCSSSVALLKGLSYDSFITAGYNCEIITFFVGALNSSQAVPSFFWKF